MRKRLFRSTGILCGALALPLGWLSAAPISSSDALSKAVFDYRQGRQSAALTEFLLIIAQSPNGSDADQSIRYIWEISHRVKQSEDALTLDPKHWQSAVAKARQIVLRRRQEAQSMLSQIETLASRLSTGNTAPLNSLRRAPLLPANLNRSDMDELSRLKAEQYLADVRQSLKTLIGKPAPDLADFHETKGYFWLYQGDLELTIQEWREALRLKPADQELEDRLSKLEAQWKIQKQREESEHELQLGISALKAGRYSDAYQRFQKAGVIDPQNDAARRYLSLAKKGMEDAARQEKIQSLLMQGHAQSQKGRLLEAVQSWVDILVLDPGNEEARQQLERTRKRLLLNFAARESAQPVPRRPQASAPSEAGALSAEKAEEDYSLGLIFYSDGELEKAKEAFAQALQAQPDHAKAKKALEQAEAELKNR